MKKGGNSNVTHNTSNMNTDITHEVISELHTSQPDDNSITDQVQMSRIGSKIWVNAVTTNNNVSVIGPRSSKRFYFQYADDGKISSMGTSKTTTRNRHDSSNNSTKYDGEIGYNRTIEINSHADTYFFVKNFQMV